MSTNTRQPVDTVVVHDEEVTWFFPVSVNGCFWFPANVGDQPYHVMDGAIPCRAGIAGDVVRWMRHAGLIVVEVVLPKPGVKLTSCMEGRSA
jgi:hypothetical protein